MPTSRIVFQRLDKERTRRVVARVRVKDAETLNPTPDGGKLDAALRRVDGLAVNTPFEWGFFLGSESLSLWPWEGLYGEVVAVYCAVLGWDPSDVEVVHESLDDVEPVSAGGRREQLLVDFEPDVGPVRPVGSGDVFPG